MAEYVLFKLLLTICCCGQKKKIPQNSLLLGTTFHFHPRDPAHHSPESTLLNSNRPMRREHHMAGRDWLAGMNDAFSESQLVVTEGT